jgi:hypothetical protein
MDISPTNGGTASSGPVGDQLLFSVIAKHDFVKIGKLFVSGV